ncbi:MAG: class I SAM-dependent methyltransferase [Pseudomonadales bacterium]|nr:class I SAM-dependent methyltransferase [Pseudomonadales bacterium]
MFFDKDLHDRGWSALDSKSFGDLDIEPLGRPHNGLEEVLSDFVQDRNAEFLIMEIGSELGGSTRFFLDYLPNSRVICIDPWPDGYKIPADFEAIAPYVEENESLLPMFLYFCRDYRDRILPLRTFSSEGIVSVYQMGMAPNVIYIDGDHRYLGTLNDLIMAHNLFPDALIVGDDWNFSSKYAIYKGIEKSVQKAATDFADHFGLELKSFANTYAVAPSIQRQRQALNYTVGRVPSP